MIWMGSVKRQYEEEENVNVKRRKKTFKGLAQNRREWDEDDALYWDLLPSELQEGILNESERIRIMDVVGGKARLWQKRPQGNGQTATMSAAWHGRFGSVWLFFVGRR